MKNIARALSSSPKKTQSTINSFLKAETPLPDNYQLSENPRSLSQTRYHPIHDAPFKYQQQVPFKFLTTAFQLVTSTTGKDSKSGQKTIMSNLFRSIILLRNDHLLKTFYLCIGKLCPDHLGIELGIGKQTLHQVVAKLTGMSSKQVKSKQAQTGDLGLVAEKGKSCQKNLSTFFVKKTKLAPLTVVQVYDTFWKIAGLHGNNSAMLKENQLISIMQRADSDQVKYLVRIAQKTLKIGANELTMQKALARAIALTPPCQTFPPKEVSQKSDIEKYEFILKKSINQCPNYDKVIEAILQIGPEGRSIEYLEEICKITPGTPLKPMLAQPTKGIQQILKRFNQIEFTCQYKYDGMRVHIHIINQDQIQLYSRGSQHLTGMFPDIIEFLKSHINFQTTSQCIIDAQVVAFDPATHKIKSFQQIQQRSKKNVDINSLQTEVCLFVFDLLYLNGDSLLNLPLWDRRNILRQNFKEFPGRFEYVKSLDTTQFEDIENLLHDSVALGCEGLMVKSLHQNALYQPARRSFNWLKLKKDYLNNNESRLADSVDLVPIGANFGIGKRQGVYGSFLLATYDEQNDSYQTICKAGSGFSDQILQELFKSLSECIIQQPQRNYHSLHSEIDVWFRPSMVWEVLGADLSVSPKHTSAWGMVKAGKGISLRFPRFVRIRSDKLPEDATGPQQIVYLYCNQSSIENELI